jgi:hypothetical protein
MTTRIVVALSIAKGAIMKSQTMIVTLLLATLFLFAFRATAQQSEDHQGGMMSRDMMAQPTG